MKTSKAFLRRTMFAAAAVAALAAWTPAAQAAFTYSVTVNNVQPFVFGGSSMTQTGAPLSGSLSGAQIINLLQITQASTTAPPATDVALVPVNLTVTINNQNGGGSGAFTILGNINVTRSDTGGAISNFILTSILPPSINLGSYVYSLGATQYAAPTLGGTAPSNGALSIAITEIVPEPASVTLMGLGLGTVGLVALRRRKQS